MTPRTLQDHVPPTPATLGPVEGQEPDELPEAALARIVGGTEGAPGGANDHNGVARRKATPILL